MNVSTRRSLLADTGYNQTVRAQSSSLPPLLVKFDTSLPAQNSPTAEMISYVLECFAVGGIVLGGVIPYIPQYLDIRKTRNAEGFSTYVCLTLLIANMLRILFWFGHPFELPLLVQSVVMTATMLFMVHVCVTVRHGSEIVASHRLKTFTDFKMSDFWQWTDFLSYVQFLCTFALVAGVFTILLIDHPWYVETLGLFAVLFEAMLGLPQFYRNAQNKSTAGMSLNMVLLWTTGDILKTVYFIVRNAPMQFWLCGILQVTLDCAILLQVFMYRRPQRSGSLR